MTSMHPEAAKYAFEATTILVSGISPPHTPDDNRENSKSSIMSSVTPENFGECVDLLISFASAAGNSDQTLHANAHIINGSQTSVSKINPSKATSSPRNNPDALRVSSSAVNGSNIERAIQAIGQLYKLHTRIPALKEQSQMGAERGKSQLIYILFFCLKNKREG